MRGGIKGYFANVKEKYKVKNSHVCTVTVRGRRHPLLPIFMRVQRAKDRFGTGCGS